MTRTRHPMTQTNRARRRSRLLPGVLLAALLALAACDRPASEPAPLSDTPPLERHAVGPVPGPDRALPQMTNPFADDPNAPVQGRRLFVWFNCYGCHGGHAGGGMGPSLRDAVWMYGNSDEDVFSSISEGRPHGMPAWGTKLPSQQIWMMVSYIQCLNRPCEPAAPPQNRSYPDAPSPTKVKGITIGGGDDG